MGLTKVDLANIAEAMLEKYLNISSKYLTGGIVVELMTIIILIGLMIMSTLPRFNHLSIDAKNLSNQGVSTALSAAVSAAHGVWVANGASNDPKGSLIISEGQQLHVNMYGWPDNNSNSTPTVDDCASIWSGILSNPPIAGCDECIQACNAKLNNGCYVTSLKGTVCKYSLATNTPITITYNISNGAVSATSQ